MHPNEDGKTHINVYSNGRTVLGRFLSNFTKCHVQTEDGIFASVEGYWYWLSTPPNHPRRHELTAAYGLSAKLIGKEIRDPNFNHPKFKEKIAFAITNKILARPDIQQLIRANNLPYVHYYVFGSKVETPKSSAWVVEVITQISEAIKNNALEISPYKD